MNYIFLVFFNLGIKDRILSKSSICSTSLSTLSILGSLGPKSISQDLFSFIMIRTLEPNPFSDTNLYNSMMQSPEMLINATEFNLNAAEQLRSSDSLHERAVPTSTTSNRNSSLPSLWINFTPTLLNMSLPLHACS